MLPDHLFMYLNSQIPCRESQILHTGTYLDPNLPSIPALVLYGQEATGKSLIVREVLVGLGGRYAIVKSRECITGRHLLERTVLACKDALKDTSPQSLDDIDGRCENLSSLAVQLQRMLQGCPKFVLVFDGIDQQREAQPTLLEALARLGEIIPTLSVVFVVNYPRPHFLHRAGVPYIEFPQYTRTEILTIVSRSPLPIFTPDALAELPPARRLECEEDDDWLWPRFCGAVWDSLGKGVARDVVRFRALCERLWPSFVQHIRSGIYGTRDFSRLMVRTRALFQNEDALKESILPSAIIPVAAVPSTTTTTVTTTPSKKPLSSSSSTTVPPAPPPLPQPQQTSKTSHSRQDLSLSYYTKWLLLAAYLASHNPPRTDTIFFSKFSDSSKKKRRRLTKHNNPSSSSTSTANPNPGPGRPPKKFNKPAKTKHRIIQRKLLGPQPFVLERWLAIFHSIVPHKVPGACGADLCTQIAGLVAVRMVVRAGAGGGGPGAAGGEVGGGVGSNVGEGKWRVNVGLEFVLGLGKGLGFEVLEYLAE